LCTSGGCIFILVTTFQLAYDIISPVQETASKKSNRREKMNKKVYLQGALLLTGVLMVFFGIWRGEAGTVLSKAIRLCMECVGIG
jgi:hypothetical protein